MKQTFVAIIEIEVPDASKGQEFAGNLVEQVVRLVNDENELLRFRGNSSSEGTITDMQIFSQVP